RHQALALRAPDRGAQVGLAAQARLTLAAFRRVQRDDVIADGKAGYARSDLDHHARAFVAQNGGEETLAVQTVQRIGVGVAHARRLDLDQHLARARAFQINLDDLERTFGFERNGGAGFHVLVLRTSLSLATRSLAASGTEAGEVMIDDLTT